MRAALKNYLQTLKAGQWHYFEDRPKQIHFAELWEAIDNGHYIKSLHVYSSSSVAKQPTIVVNDEYTAFKIIRPEKHETSQFKKVQIHKFNRYDYSEIKCN